MASMPVVYGMSSHSRRVRLPSPPLDIPDTQLLATGPAKANAGPVDSQSGRITVGDMSVALKVSTKRELCGTSEAARIYGCQMSHIRGMATRGEIWSEQLSERIFVYDANEIRRLAADREKLRRAGKLCGIPPGTSRK